MDRISSFSVIVPARNAASTIERCIASLRALSPPADEIIVVDDASDDVTASLAAAQSVTVIRSASNVGPGLARNLGAGAANGEFLAFTDSDCEVPPDWLVQFRAVLSDGKYCGATGPYAGTTHPTLLTLLIDRSLRYNQRSLPGEIESCISSNLCVRKSDFDSVGGFPAYSLPGSKMCYFGNEDEELAHLLAQRTGKPMKWLPEKGVFHAYRATWSSYFRQQARYAEAILVSCARSFSMLRGRSNYSRGGGALKVLTAYLAIGGAAVTPFFPYAVACTFPFWILNFGCVSYLVKCEPYRKLKIAFGIAGYPFLLFTAIAWSCGLATGAFKALAGLLTWRQPRPGSAKKVRA